jgi:ubiquinone/menaquinone biosynthesis C-methylase UbiE
LSDQPRFERTAERYAKEAAGRDWSGVIDCALPQPSDVALDVGAGPGMLSAALLGRVSRAVALDSSEALLSYAPAGVEAVLGDAESMPFADSSFDLVTCVNALHHLARPAAALAEVARVVAPGGRIVLQDYLADPDPEAARRWDEIERLRAEDHYRLLRRGEAGEELAARGLVAEEEQEWPSTWEVGAWTELAGCDAATSARIRELVGAPTFTVRAWRARYRRPRGTVASVS